MKMLFVGNLEKKDFKPFCEIVILVILIFYGLSAYRNSKAVRLDISGIQIIAENQGCEFAIENVDKPEIEPRKYVYVKGWVVEKNVKSRSSDKIKVTLKKTDSNDYYCIPTVRQLRKDVTKRFYDGTKYDDSGFEGKLQFCEEVDPEYGEYEIYIYLENKNGKKLINTNIKLNEWINNNSQ